MLTEEIVQSIAKLARLRLSEGEATAFGRQLSAVLRSFNEISQVDTAGVEPLVTPSEITPRLRADVVEPAAGAEEIIANAPEKTGRLFKVPPVV